MPFPAPAPSPQPASRRASPLPVAVAGALLGLLASAAIAGDPRPAPPGRGLEGFGALTDTLFRQARYDSIRVLMSARLVAARGAGDRQALLWLVRRDAELRLSGGDARGGLAAADEAAALAAALGDTLTLIDALRWRDYAYQQLGRHDEAGRDARRMDALARATGAGYYVGRAHISFGWEAMRAGDYRGSLRHYLAADETLRLRGAPGERCLPLLGAGEAAYSLGDPARARSLAEEALELARETGSVRYQAWALGNLARIAVNRGDRSAALERYRTAYELFRDRGFHQHAAYPGSEVAWILMDLGRFDESTALLDSMVAASERQGQLEPIPMLLEVEGHVRLRQGQPRKAEALFRRALAFGERATVNTRGFTLVGLGHALEAQGRREEALAMLRREAPGLRPRATPDCASNLEQLEHDLLLGSGRYAEAAPLYEAAAPRYERAGFWMSAADGWLGAGIARRALGEPALAMADFERAQGAWERARSQPRDPEFREQAGGRGSELAGQLVDLMLEWPPTDGPADRARAAWQRLQHFRGRTLLERIAGPRGGSPGLPTTLAAPSHTALQRDVLREGEVLLEYLVGRERTLLFAITRDTTRLVRLAGGAELGQQVSLLRELLARHPTPGQDDTLLVRRAAARLGIVLLGGVSDLIEGARAVLVVRDGPLHQLPFGALLAPAAEATWLADRATVLHLPSAALLAHARAAAPRRGHGLLAVGDDGRGGALPGARDEVRALARGYRDVRVVEAGPTGTAPLARAELAAWDVLHFAGHTVASDARPWDSTLPTLRLEDGRPLTAAGIARLSLTARLAVLASCESAGGRMRSGEGLSGLSSAFLAAGVPTVMASHWRVEDRSTARLIERFYRELARGKSAAEALRLAQRALRADPATAHPFHWAGLGLIGDDARDLALVRQPFAPDRVAVYALVASLALAAAFAARGRWSSRRPRGAL